MNWKGEEIEVVPQIITTGDSCSRYEIARVFYEISWLVSNIQREESQTEFPDLYQNHLLTVIIGMVEILINIIWFCS